MSKLTVIAGLWSFLKVRKKFWLAPIILVLITLGFIIAVTQGSALAPYIYAMF